jgi:hypothetical protein
MALRILQTRRVALHICSAEIRVDQLNQPVQVFRRDRLVLLVEVVDVAVEDFDEELD